MSQQIERRLRALETRAKATGQTPDEEAAELYQKLITKADVLVEHGHLSVSDRGELEMGPLMEPTIGGRRNPFYDEAQDFLRFWNTFMNGKVTVLDLE